MAQTNRRTPAQIAQDNLNEARAKLTVLKHRQTNRREALDQTNADVAYLEKQIAVLEQHPDLPPQPEPAPIRSSVNTFPDLPPQPDAELGDEAERTAGVAQPRNEPASLDVAGGESYQ
jgi:hypothetical protein